MRVLHVLPGDLARGAQVYARSLVDQLNGSGDVHQIATLFAGAAGSARPDIALDARPPGALLRVWRDPRAVRRLRDLVAEIGPDIVVGHGLDPFKYVAALRGPALVCLGIGVAFDKALRPPRRRIYTTALHRANAFVGVSDEVTEQARHCFGVPRAKARTIVNGRDETLFAAPVRADTDEPLVAFVGQLTPPKRPELFVEVVRRLRADGLAVRGRLIGDGPLVDALSGPAREAGVDLLGRREDVSSLLARADLLLFTSRPAGEGMPGVLIEAGLCGLPVVATDMPGVRTVVDDGKTGLIVPVDDIDALTAATGRLVREAALRRQLGGAARLRCVERFTLARGADAWRELFAELCRSPPG